MQRGTVVTGLLNYVDVHSALRDAAKSIISSGDLTRYKNYHELLTAHSKIFPDETLPNIDKDEDLQDAFVSMHKIFLDEHWKTTSENMVMDSLTRLGLPCTVEMTRDLASPELPRRLEVRRNLKSKRASLADLQMELVASEYQVPDSMLHDVAHYCTREFMQDLATELDCNTADLVQKKQENREMFKKVFVRVLTKQTDVVKQYIFNVMRQNQQQRLAVAL